MDDKVASLVQALSNSLQNRNSWDDFSSSWSQITSTFCSFKKEEIRSESCIILAKKILLAPLNIEVNDEFSVRPRNMMGTFEEWTNVYDAVIDSCLENTDQCCAFANSLSCEILQRMQIEKMDCRLLYLYSQIIRSQIENFDYDVLRDIFIGDFDLSGKGNVLGSFCNLLVEIQKNSIAVLLKHSDKQTGIVAELLSKSVLNILEGATCLLAQMTESANIVFVISALAKFIGECIARVLGKSCKMFVKNQKNVTLMVKTALSTLKKHYSGPYGTSLLTQLEPIFIDGFRWPRTRQCLVNFWQQTFGRANHFDLSDAMILALECNKGALATFASEPKSLSLSESSKLSILYDGNISTDTIARSCSNEENVASKHPRNTQPSTSDPAHFSKNSTDQYVIIEAPVVAKKMRLTEHQKEKFAEKSDSVLCLVDESHSIDFKARIPPGFTDSCSEEGPPTTKIPIPEVATCVKNCQLRSETSSGAYVEIADQDLTIKKNAEYSFLNNAAGDVLLKEAENNSLVRKEGHCENGGEFCRLSEATFGFDREEAMAGIEITLPDQNAEIAEHKVVGAVPLLERCETPDNGVILSVSVSPEENGDEAPRTPSSILKKIGTNASCPVVKFFSASGKKCKHVHFDASTLDDDDIYGAPRRKIFRRPKKSLFHSPSLDGHSRSSSPPERLAISSINRNPAKAVFPMLVGSEELIPPQIYLKLAPSMSSIALRSLMKSRGVATVGDLACLSEQDIETLPFREPKLVRLQKALDDHFRMKSKMSKEDNFELENIMKYAKKKPGDLIEGVYSKTNCNDPVSNGYENISQKTPEKPIAERKATSEAHINIVTSSEATAELNYDLPRQHSSQASASSSTEHLEGSDTADSSLLRRKQNLMEMNGDTPFSEKQCNVKESTETTVLSLSKCDTGRNHLDMKLPRKLQSQNTFTESREIQLTTNQDMKFGKECNKDDDVDSPLRSAFRTLLKDHVVAATAGAIKTPKFSSEQLLAFSQACATFQMTVLTLARKMDDKEA